ncbi:MAG: PilN domain-containing protein [Pseudomonas sp.]
MLSLNLLPWREHQRQAEIRRLSVRLAAIGLLTVLIVCLGDYLVRQAQQRQGLENASLQQAIAQLDGQLAKIAQHGVEQEQVKQHQQVLERLQGQRLFLFELFEHLEAVVPEGVYLTAVTHEDAGLHLQGVARSGTLVAQLLRGLSGAFGEAMLQHASAVDEGEAFEVSVVMRPKP